VVVTQYEGSTASRTRPYYLTCRDAEPRCSVAASVVAEHVASGSRAGGIHVWDASTGRAAYFWRDKVWISLTQAGRTNSDPSGNACMLATSNDAKSRLGTGHEREDCLSKSESALHLQRKCCKDTHTVGLPYLKGACYPLQPM
jgi:hypothetical protein